MIPEKFDRTKAQTDRLVEILRGVRDKSKKAIADYDAAVDSNLDPDGAKKGREIVVARTKQAWNNVVAEARKNMSDTIVDAAIKELDKEPS